MTRQLRKGNGQTGLILANGGVVTYQYAVCLSTKPRRDGQPYPDRNPLPEYVTDVQVPVIEEKADGVATIEVSHMPNTLRSRRQWLMNLDIYRRI